MTTPISTTPIATTPIPITPIPATFLMLLTTWRELSMDALEGTQTIARRLVQRRSRGIWLAYESQISSLLVGGVLPLLGHVLFGWPAFLVIAGIAIDVTVLWLSDVLKPWFNRTAFTQQLKAQCDAADAISLARTLLTPPRQRQQDGTGTPYYRVVQRLNRGTPYVSRDYLRMGAIICLLPPLLVALSIHAWVPEADRLRVCAILLAPVLIRCVLAAFAVRASGATRTRSLGLLPQAGESLATFYLTAMSYAAVGGALDKTVGSAWLDAHQALLFLALYLLASVGVAWYSLRDMRSADAALRQFAAMSPQQLYAVLTPNYRKGGVAQDISQ